MPKKDEPLELIGQSGSECGMSEVETLAELLVEYVNE